MIEIEKVDETYIRIHADSGIKREIMEYFSFFAQNYKWNPLFRNKVWDGKIRLFDFKNSLLYHGLLKKLIEFAIERKYKVSFTNSLDFSEIPVSVKEFHDFLNEIHLEKKPRDYQENAILKGIRKKRATFLSPTASGKSLIIYLLSRFLRKKTLVIVPTISLVLQMKADFLDYGMEDDNFADGDVSIIMGGHSKDNLAQITVSTWQSIANLPVDWFSQFETVILDEAHLGKAKMITGIMKKCSNAEYRFGLTGTLEDTEMSELTITGLFGPIYNVAETKDLIEKGTLSNLNIKCITFQYEEEIRKMNKSLDYSEEIDYLVGYEARNKFIMNLAVSLTGNTLILFGRVEKHGKVLYQKLQEMTDKKVFFISGEISGKIREEIRKEVENEKKDCIIVASTGVFSTGVNIVHLHNILMAHPTKSKIKILQSIGRGLRKGEDKELCTVFDFSDDFTYKSKKNYTYEHFLARLKIYATAGFKFKTHNVKI